MALEETSPRITVFSWGRIITAMAIMLAVVAVLSFAIGQTVSTINNRLDRNCRILATILADNRFLIIEHSGNRPQADAFRQIFNKALVENCGKDTG